MSFYFDQFEQRKPPELLPYSAGRELLYQFLATVTLVIGAWYLVALGSFPEL
jgi:cellulose synthase (UDP-forming)